MNNMLLKSCLFVVCLCSCLQAETMVDFEDLGLPPNSAAPGDPSQVSAFSRGVEFNRTWNTDFDCCPGAWAISNQIDLTTAGFTNPYSAFVLPNGGGVDDSATFAIANNGVQGQAQVRFPEPATVRGTYVANTTYAALAIRDGNDAAGFVKGPFAENDWFRLEFVGFNDQSQELGNVEFYLADFRNGASNVVSDWTWVDLTSLGDEVSRLEFRLLSTDVGDFGMNTPAYFAIDNLSYEVVPEPTTLTWFAVVIVGAFFLRR
ncbi:MAG: DUF4465 domain-containing protein [Planctomycetaceae bacterium]|nr:DUF4465 domain-containing protein [Planctomycetaceae bacterium]